jgi:hypothetical protein
MAAPGNPLDELKSSILAETKTLSSFVAIGCALYRLYYTDKLIKNQRDFLAWTKANLGFRYAVARLQSHSVPMGV